ncbi:MAG: xanthine dehydrogenase family protein molybdopterin-binding subunit, partial [Sphingomonadales bacterium]|nr:xanthine dehydrogenase family protein molybdopterin-binding subunit [Sphingomonadales bacterium]
PNGDYDTDVARKDMEERVSDEGKIERDRGDFKTAFADADQIVDAAYYVPHHAHASMEPPVALADFKDGKLEIWTPTQNPQSAEGALMQYLGLKREDITMHVPLTGGGFGRKGKPDFAIEAAMISREIGAPVKMVWSREDDIRHCYYHSSAAQRLQASLDKKGRVTGWRHHTTFPSISETFSTEVTSPGSSEVGMGASNVPFDIPNIRVESSYSKAQVRIGWSRAVHNINHAFAIGSFVDELAHAAKKDSAKYLLELIGKPRIVNLPKDGVTAYGYERHMPSHPIDTGRLAAVVKAVMKKAKWGRRMPKGRAMGIAVHRSFLTYVASIVEVDMTGDELKIPNVWYAVDCGQVVNVDRVKAQFEGGAMYALSHALTGKITAKNGAVEQSNYHDFEVLRMGMAPTVHVHLMDSDRDPTGVGEPPVPSIAPALTNAIFAASGQRIRELPVMEKLAQ